MTQPLAVRMIRDEHLAIASVVYSLRFLARRIRAGEPADFRLLRAMLDYIVEFPDRWHHPKEDRFLFAALRARDPRAGKLIDELEREHVEGGELIEGLKHALLRFESREPDSGEAFVDAVERYAEFQWEHMRKEEDLLLPLAEKSLTEADWAAIAAAFRENDNPLFGIRPKEQADQLYQRILSLAPPPIGLRS